MRLLAFTILAVLLNFLPAHSTISLRCVDVLVPADIKPYMEALRGIEKVFSPVRPHIVDKEDPDRLKDLIKRSPCEAVVALGSSGISIAASAEKKLKVYSFVLYPEKYERIIKAFNCGVPLNVSPPWIATNLSKYFPRKRIGIIYSDSGIDYYVDDIVAEVKKAGLVIKKVRLSSLEEFNRGFEGFIIGVDVILVIPDPVFSSEEAIRWIIKRCALLKKGVIGFNRFFIRSGAVAAFVADYEAIGRVTAELLKDLLLRGRCSSQDPPVRFIVNKKVYKYLFGHEP